MRVQLCLGARGLGVQWAVWRVQCSTEVYTRRAALARAWQASATAAVLAGAGGLGAAHGHCMTLETGAQLRAY